MNDIQKRMLFLALEEAANALVFFALVVGLIALKCWIDPA